MRPSIQILLVAIASLLVACGRTSPDSSGASASAIAFTAKDGSEVGLEPTSEESAYLNQSLQELKALDRTEPLSELPANPTLYHAKAMIAPATFVLDSGAHVQIDGISCTEKGLELLSKIWLSPGTFIAFKPTGTRSSQNTLAEVWIVESGSLDNRGSVQSSSPAGHNAIGTGACAAVDSPTNRYNERYKLFSKYVATIHPELVGKGR